METQLDAASQTLQRVRTQLATPHSLRSQLTRGVPSQADGSSVLVCIRAIAAPGREDRVAPCSLHVVLLLGVAGSGAACLLFPSLQSRFWVDGKVSVLKGEQSSLLNEEDCLALLFLMGFIHLFLFGC